MTETKHIVISVTSELVTQFNLNEGGILTRIRFNMKVHVNQRVTLKCDLNFEIIFDKTWRQIRRNARFDTTQSLGPTTLQCSQGNVPIKRWRNTDEGSPPGIRISLDHWPCWRSSPPGAGTPRSRWGRPSPRSCIASCSAPGSEPRPQTWSKFCVDCEDSFSFFSADQTVANVSLMQKCLNEIACYFAFSKLDFLSRSKSLISR